jgi:LuxR family maltose regulon positive regulatory protein
LISAPTGFGKTTLVAQWVSERMKNEGRTMKVEDRKINSFHPSSFIHHPSKFSWVSLDAGDNDPIRFWTYVITALRTLDASIGKNALAALFTSQPISLQAILTPLINDLARLSGPYVLILEDYHAITSAEIHASVSFLLQHLPAALHLVLVSRTEPDLPLPILRARDELVELDAASLRFSPAETEAFLRAAVRVELPASAAAKLQERTEGWAAYRGLRRSLQNVGDRAELRNSSRPSPEASVISPTI